jgi:hypothetical protein
MGDLQGWALGLDQDSCIDASMMKWAILDKWLFINMGKWLMAMTFLELAKPVVSGRGVVVQGSNAGVRQRGQALGASTTKPSPCPVHCQLFEHLLSASDNTRTTNRQTRQRGARFPCAWHSLHQPAATVHYHLVSFLPTSQSRSQSQQVPWARAAVQQDSDLRTLRSHSSTQDPKITDAQSKSQTALLL